MLFAIQRQMHISVGCSVFSEGHWGGRHNSGTEDLTRLVLGWISAKVDLSAVNLLLLGVDLNL